MGKESSLLQRLSQEGGVVEICVKSTTLKDWQAAVGGLLASGYPMKFSFHGEPAALNLSAETFGKSFDSVYSLEVAVGSQVWATDFVRLDLIDFQCSPRLISDPTEIQFLSEFMRNIAASVRKIVEFIPEAVHPDKVEPYARVDTQGVFRIR
ncbi:hypothetical protein [Streptomyces sp. NPDC058665]|uniref:hypothetical protein n=1 Tax=Streptomyces sp. NPDC058665 TaxID=3346586 RepID=UPI00365F8222